jgi:hypothetical protein
MNVGILWKARVGNFAQLKPF